MNQVELKRLSGAIKITRSADSIGLPVFTSPFSNAMYVPEMDAELRISDFLIFTNRERFLIDRILPEESKITGYRPNDFSPIPYWHGGRCHIISGDAEPSELIKIHGRAIQNFEVLKSLADILEKARNGSFKQEQEQWIANDISATFKDVFHEPPIHSRYWVGRFTQAIEHARKLAKSPHVIDNELRRVGIEWVKRFATKTDFPRLTSVVGSLIGNVIEKGNAQGIFFSYIMHQINSGNFSKIEKAIISSNEFTALFPYGIYNYYRENGWPDEGFSYSKPFGILDPFYRALQVAEFRNDHKRLERLSYAYFRAGDAPCEIGDAVEPMIYNLTDEFMNLKRRMGDDYYAQSIPESTALKNQLCEIYISMMSLDGVMHGNVRLSETIIDRRFGLDARYITELLNEYKISNGPK